MSKTFYRLYLRFAICLPFILYLMVEPVVFKAMTGINNNYITQLTDTLKQNTLNILPEICNNGIDDDNDGLIDSYDSDCPCNDLHFNTSCDKECQILPDSFSTIKMKLKWKSMPISTKDISLSLTVLISSIDESCIVPSSFRFGSRFINQILSFNLKDGLLNNTFSRDTINVSNNGEITTGDILKNKNLDIFRRNTNLGLNRITENGLSWINNTGPLTRYKTRFPKLSDFNNDEIAELYCGNIVLNALTGNILINAGSSAGCNFFSTFDLCSFGAHSIAGEITDHPGLELACGNAVYELNINNTNGEIGNTYNTISAPTNVKDGFTSIADIDGDGLLDVIVVRTNLMGDGGLWVWNPRSQTIIAETYNTGRDGGLATIADLDGDCLPEIIVIFRNLLNVYSYDKTNYLKLKFNIVINEGSGNTVAVPFDLNGDGLLEIIYRDEEALKIFDGRNGALIDQYNLSSLTYGESPTISAVNNGGPAIILVTGMAEDEPDSLRVFCFESATTPWAPARQVWNQTGYHVTNVNDDMTIPRYQQNMAVSFDTDSCAQRTCPQVYNNFMTQATFRTQKGCKVWPSLPDLALDATAVSHCDSIDFCFIIKDRPDTNTQIPLSYYPISRNVGNMLIETIILTADTTCIRLPAIAGIDSFALVANDRGGNFPTAVDFGFDECSYENNIIKVAVKYTRPELNLTANPCMGDTYVFRDSTWTLSGHYTYSSGMCDSIFYIDLRFENTSDFFMSQEICQGDAYNFFGQNITSSGQYTHTLTNQAGCDSIVYLDLNVLPPSEVTQTHAACDTYTWNGQTYTQSGTYTYQTQTRYGCDSIITLDLTISNILRTNHPVTACDNYTWNGVIYDTGGDYTFSGQSIQGCDSIATLQLVIHPSTTSSLSQTACDAYTWNGQIYDQSGIYTYRTQNTFGCDSVVTISLTVNRASASSADINACSQYTWNGQTYTQSGTYDYQTTNIHGCDSIATLRLYIYQPDMVSAQQSACDTYTWNGQTYTQSGYYTFATQNRYGCDSLTTLDLTIFPSETRTLQETACDSLVYHGRNLTQSGIYTFDLQNRFGCDSIITLDLSISGDKISNSLSACKQYTWPIDGQTYTSSGIYTERYTNLAGCDSIYTLDLIIHPDYEIITDAEACAQYLWPTTNQRYTQSGTYAFPLKTAHGCDSTLTLDLVIHPEFEFRDTVFATEPYLWPINNITYDISGIYSETFSTDISCDSIHYLYLTIKNTTDIYFPNIISPDGNNGFFTGYSSNTSAIIASLSIYDRWGNLLFTKENFPPNDPQQGWNGKFSGTDVGPGVYVFAAVVRLPDGSLETFSGDVTVVR